jgi:hypothetical protein
MPGNRKKRNIISDEIAVRLINEYESKLFWAGEKTIWYKTKATMYNVSTTSIVNLMYNRRGKYLVPLE